MWMASKNIDLSYTKYLSKCVNDNFKPVSFIDWKNIVEYFKTTQPNDDKKISSKNTVRFIQFFIKRKSDKS